jgi:hypothetical protein
MRDIRTPKDFAEVVGDSKLSQLREAVAPKKKRGSWLRHLDDKQLSEVYFRLSKGESALSIARIAQKEWGVMKKSSTVSLGRAVRDFADDVLGEIRALAIREANPLKKPTEEASRVVALSKEVSKKLDAVKEYIWMIEAQKVRINSLIKAESKSIPFEVTDKALRNLREMLDGYATLCIKLGIVDSRPPELNVNLKHQFENIMQTVVRNDKAKLMNACDQFVSQLEQSAIMLTQNDDGSFDLDIDEDLCES